MSNDKTIALLQDHLAQLEVAYRDALDALTSARTACERAGSRRQDAQERLLAELQRGMVKS